MGFLAQCERLHEGLPLFPANHWGPGELWGLLCQGHGYRKFYACIRVFYAGRGTITNSVKSSSTFFWGRYGVMGSWVPDRSEWAPAGSL